MSNDSIRLSIKLPKIVADYYREQAKLRMLPFSNYLSYIIISKYCKDNNLNIDDFSGGNNG